MRPNGGGVYGLSNAQGWIYINTAENIQAALLNHLSELNRVSSFQTATGCIDLPGGIGAEPLSCIAE